MKSCSASGSEWCCDRATYVKKGGPWCRAHYVQLRKGAPIAPVRSHGISHLRDSGGRKLCARCGVWKVVSEYPRKKGTPDGLAIPCRTCVQSMRLFEYYRLSVSGFDELLLSQGGKCAVCPRTEPNGHGWHVDHDHSCCSGTKSCGGCVRGVLCSGCNTALGMVKDDISILTGLIRYLEERK